jgi:hypothetical protein
VLAVVCQSPKQWALSGSTSINRTLKGATGNNLSKGSVDEEEEWNRGIPPAEVARSVIGSLEKDEYEIVVGEVKGLVRGATTNPEQVFKSLNEW